MVLIKSKMLLNTFYQKYVQLLFIMGMMGSVMVWLEVIPLSGIHCTCQKNNFFMSCFYVSVFQLPDFGLLVWTRRMVS
jgi:hypothetical protein